MVIVNHVIIRLLIANSNHLAAITFDCYYHNDFLNVIHFDFSFTKLTKMTKLN